MSIHLAIIKAFFPLNTKQNLKRSNPNITIFVSTADLYVILVRSYFFLNVWICTRFYPGCNYIKYRNERDKFRLNLSRNAICFQAKLYPKPIMWNATIRQKRCLTPIITIKVLRKFLKSKNPLFKLICTFWKFIFKPKFK